MHTNTENDYNYIIIILVSTAYCINRFLLKEVIRLPLISYILKCYFNDWLAGIGIIAYLNLLCGVSSWQCRKVADISSAAFICLICGLLWEYALPELIQCGTSDFWDIAAYIIGGISYVLIFHTYTKHYYRNNCCKAINNERK